MCLAVFQSATDAALAQQRLLASGLNTAIMPKPRDLSASCGLSLRFSTETAQDVLAILSQLFPGKDRCRYFQARGWGKTREVLPLQLPGEPLEGKESGVS